MNARVTPRLAVLVSADIVILVFVGVAGSHALSGPEIIRITTGHGMHLLDVFVMALGGLGLVGVWWPFVAARRLQGRRLEEVERR